MEYSYTGFLIELIHFLFRNMNYTAFVSTCGTLVTSSFQCMIENFSIHVLRKSFTMFQVVDDGAISRLLNGCLPS